MRTQYDEFVNLLQSWAAFDLLKAKFCHLEAIVEHERMVRSVATICDKRNAIANINISTENTLEAVGLVADVSADVCSKAVSNFNLRLECDQDDSVDRECVQDDGKTDRTVGNECEQDDRNSELDCDRVGFVNNGCGQNDWKPETNCTGTLDDGCEQDDCNIGCTFDTGTRKIIGKGFGNSGDKGSSGGSGSSGTKQATTNVNIDDVWSIINFVIDPGYTQAYDKLTIENSSIRR